MADNTKNDPPKPAAKRAPTRKPAAKSPPKAASTKAKQSVSQRATKASKGAVDSVKKNPGTAAAIAGGVVAAVAGVAFGASQLAKSRGKKTQPAPLGDDEGPIDPNAVPEGVSVQ